MKIIMMVIMIIVVVLSSKMESCLDLAIKIMILLLIQLLSGLIVSVYLVLGRIVWQKCWIIKLFSSWQWVHYPQCPHHHHCWSLLSVCSTHCIVVPHVLSSVYGTAVLCPVRTIINWWILLPLRKWDTRHPFCTPIALLPWWSSWFWLQE